MSDTKPHRTGVGVIAFPAAVVSVAWCLAVTRWSFEWPTALAALAAALLPAVVAFVTTTELVAWRWARDRGVDFESALVPQVHRHLVRTRVARTFGVTVPMAVDMMLMSRYNASDGSFRWFMDAWNPELRGLWQSGAGYVVATVWVELTKPRELTGRGPGVAVLAPRRLRDFADRGVLRWVAPMFVAVSIAALIWSAAPDPAEPVRNRLHEGVVVGALLTAVLAVVVAAAVCRRSERAADDVAVAYEELTRSGTVNALLGVAIGMLGQVVGELLGSQPVAEWLTPWVTIPSAVIFVLGPLATWYAAGTKFVFRSRRIDALRDRALAPGGVGTASA